jgi:hypothetical protein
VEEAFQQLLQSGIVGYYQSATITSVLLHQKQHGGNPLFHNVYTLAALHEAKPIRENRVRKISDAPLLLKGAGSAVIVSQTVSLDTLSKLYCEYIKAGDLAAARLSSANDRPA